MVKRLGKTFNRRYTENLKLVESIIGDGITNGEQLYILSKQIFGDKFKGIYIKKEMLPPLKNHGDFAILNEPENQHWISIFNHDGTMFEFDSFGRDMLGVGFHDFNNKTDAIHDQQLLEQNCGSRVISFMTTLLSK